MGYRAGLHMGAQRAASGNACCSGAEAASGQRQREGDAELRGFVQTLLSERSWSGCPGRGGHAAVGARQVAYRKWVYMRAREI
jgi:hypothetical protein